MLPMASQVLVLVFMVVAGFAVGFMYDVYRVIRSLVRPNRRVSVLMDLAFWLFVTPVIFVALLAGNWGQLRLYVFLGMALGLFCYFQLLSEAVLWILICGFRSLTHKVTAAVCALMRLASGPVRAFHSLRRGVGYFGRPPMAGRRWVFRWGRSWPFFRR